MIVNRVDTRHDLVTVTPESPDDLWILRRVICKSDLVAGETSRVFKETAEYARPDKERIKVTVTIEVEGVKIDNTLSRLRISGKILDVSNDLISKGSFHSLNVSEGHRLSIRKPTGFNPVQLRLIQNSDKPADSYAIVTLDRRDAGLGIVKGTHLQLLPTIESGITGKMYQEKGSKSSSTSNYFDRIADALSSLSSDGKKRVYVLGPSTTKNAFVNYVNQNRNKEFAEVKAIEGSDVSGEDGVYVALRTPNLQEALSESRLAKVSKILAEVMRRISLGDSRITLAFNDSLKAAKAGP